MGEVVKIHDLTGYSLRPTTLVDLPLAQAWNALDKDHAWEGENKAYWIEQSPHVNTYVLEDAEGVIFFVRLQRLIGGRPSVEISIQFDFSKGDQQPPRVVLAMQRGFKWLKKALVANGFEAIYFTSKSPRLILFAKRKLGFVRVEPDRVSAAAGFERFYFQIVDVTTEKTT